MLAEDFEAIGRLLPRRTWLNVDIAVKGAKAQVDVPAVAKRWGVRGNIKPFHMLIEFMCQHK